MCDRGKYYNETKMECQDCHESCFECVEDTSCLSCKDQIMIRSSSESLCQCPEGLILNNELSLCLEYNNFSGRWIFNTDSLQNLRSQVTENEHRFLTTQSSAINIQGSSQTFTSIDFNSTDGTFLSTYMITVDTATYTSNMVIQFSSCSVTVTGNFLYSTRPVDLQFDGCTFNIANTSSLIFLDYSGYCTNSDGFGTLTIKNSIFQDYTPTYPDSSLTSRSLFYIKSLYDITLSSVTFLNMQQAHMGYFYDYGCSSSLTKAQNISFDQITANDTNMQIQFSYQYIWKVASQLNFTISNSMFYDIETSREFMTFYLLNQTAQQFYLYNNEFEYLNLASSPLLNFALNTSTIDITYSIVKSSIMQDFIKISNAEAVIVRSSNSFDNITQTGLSTQLTKGLLNIQSCTSATIDSVTITSSELLYSPMIYADTVTFFYHTNNVASNVLLQNADFIYVKKPNIYYSDSNTFTTITVSSSESSTFQFVYPILDLRYIYNLNTLYLQSSSSSFIIQNVALKFSQIMIFTVKSIILQQVMQAKSYSLASSSDTSQYSFQLKTCTLSGNTYSDLSLYSFSDISTSSMNLETSSCISSSALPTCSSGYYYDTVLQSCTACPTGCATCTSETQCTSCSAATATVSSSTGLCACPDYWYFYNVDYARCRQCLSKCATCNNEYKCLTYKTCTNQYQTLSNGACSFQCTSGYHITADTCGTCSDSNCLLCDQNSTTQNCALCSSDYYLDLSTYTCVSTCPTSSMAITTTNTRDKSGTTVKYCRPMGTYLGQSNYYQYWVDPSSASQFELGTYEYPFKNVDSPAKEILNFMYDKTTQVSVYVMRGVSTKIYYGLMPLVFVNVQWFNYTTYGDTSKANPYIYITGHEYLWPDSTLFSLAETYYDFKTRVSRGDMDTSESTKFFLKFNVFRSSLAIINLDFQSIMFGDAWSNPLIFTYDAPNCTVYVEGCQLDLDGAFIEGYYPISSWSKGNHFNLTNYQYGFWLDYRWDCYANSATTLRAYMIIEDNLFTGLHQQALYNFIFFSSFDDYILRNNTFDGCTYLDMETRPFQDVHPQSMCDPDFRTQLVYIDNNKFINLAKSNLIFAVNYMTQFNGTKIFSMQNNSYYNSSINTKFIQMQIYYGSTVTVANNYYSNVTVEKDDKIFYFYSDSSNITITNETLIGNTLDDLYTIGAAYNILVKDFKVTNNTNTGSITETSAILRISTANNYCQINDLYVSNSTFMYGKAIEIESAMYLDFSNATYQYNKLQNQDFFVFNQIVKSKIQNLQFIYFTKQSDKSRYAISMPTLTLTSAVSEHYLYNISFTFSSSSFLSVSQVQLVSSTDKSNYLFNVSDCMVKNNTLSSKDSLIEFGEINYINLMITLSNVSIQNNVLELGTMYSLKMNLKQMLIQNSEVTYNQGQFALLEPASSDTSNPLVFVITNTSFLYNYAKSDALIQMTTNSIMKASDSLFLENYSIGRGSIVFADYQAVYALFTNCNFTRNYAYQGGAFYIQYSSAVEISNCTITENFAVTGGVAYVNNDGQILINQRSKVYKNSALNTCFLFLINTQYESIISNITITQNDQNNALIPKTNFLSQTTSYQHIQKTFFTAMQAISDKVSRTINEKADSSVYAIKAKVNFTFSDIFANDVFLSASTESTVGIYNSSISDLTATGKIFQAVSSTIEMVGIVLKNIAYYLGPSDSNFYKISIVNKSTLKVQNCTFMSIYGLLLYVSGSTLKMEAGTTFFNVTNNDRDSPLISVDTSAMTVNGSNFTNVSSLYYSPIISLQENTVSVSQTLFRRFDKTLFSIDTGDYSFDTVDITEGQMTWQTGERSYMVNSIVYDVSGANLKITNSNISGIFTNYSSPIIYIENDASATSTILLNLTNSRFVNNTATESAGVIYSLNTNLIANYCLFENNTAMTYDAGALYLDCQDIATYACTYNIFNSIFKNNTAKVNGGAIKFTYYKPNTTVNNTFTKNKAEYGSDMASFALQMYIVDNTTATTRRLAMLNTTQVAALGITNGIVYQIDQPLVSGSLITQNVSLTLIDDTSRVLITDNSSIAVMSSNSSSVQVMKSKSVKAVKGIFTFDDVIIIGPPGQNILLKINSDSINKAKIAKAFPNLGTIPDIYLTGYLRYCTRGEYQSSDNKCIECSDGFYTLAENQKSCNECPENAVCTDGYKIQVDAGYWRKDVNSTSIYECYNAESCLGGYDVSCANGYGGNLCQSCVKYQDNWFSRESANTCSECIPYNVNAGRLSGVSIFIVLYFFVLIYVNIKTAGHAKVTTVYLRILTNYFQILTLASSYDLSWNDNMKKFLEAISFIGQSSQIILSVDCFIRDNGVQTEPHYVKMVLACLFPLACILIVGIFWGIVHLFRKNIKAMTKLVTSIIILIFITLPTVTTITFSIYNCIDIFNNGDSYLALDMSLQCWANDHNYYAKNFGIPIILVWIVGLPLIAFFILFRNRAKLGEEENLVKYGFLYVGLNHSAFYWEILLHFRKVLMISINVFFTTFKPLYRALIGFMLMIIYIEVLQKIQPYSSQQINDLEFKANIAAFATFYGGLFFISDDLPFGVSILLFVLILLINIVFWFTWFKMMFSNSYIRIKRMIMRVFCKNQLKAMDEKLENVEQLDFEDQKKKELQGEGEVEGEEKDKSYLNDDSHRYALAANQSNRNDDTFRNQDPTNLIISNYQEKTKGGKAQKKTKIVRGESESGSMTGSNDNTKKHKRKEKSKKKVVESDDSISQDTDSNKSDSEPKSGKNKKKKKTPKPEKKQSTSDFENSHSQEKPDSSSPNNKKNAGEIMDKTSSLDNHSGQNTKSPKIKEKVAQNSDQILSFKADSDRRDSVQEDPSPAKKNRNSSKSKVDSPKKKEVKGKASSDSSDDNQSSIAHLKETKSKLPQKDAEIAARAFRNTKQVVEEMKDDDGEQSAKIHSIKHKRKGNNSKGKIHNDVAIKAKGQNSNDQAFQISNKKNMDNTPKGINRLSSNPDESNDEYPQNKQKRVSPNNKQKVQQKFDESVDLENFSSYHEEPKQRSKSRQNNSRSKPRQQQPSDSEESEEVVKQPKKKVKKVKVTKKKKNVIEDSSSEPYSNPKKQSKQNDSQSRSKSRKRPEEEELDVSDSEVQDKIYKNKQKSKSKQRTKEIKQESSD